MISVGCRLTRVARSELNSEYRRRTSHSCKILDNKAPLFDVPYPCPNCIGYVASPTLMTFARIGNQDLEILILVENLLNTAIVAAFLLWSSLLDIFLVLVT